MDEEKKRILIEKLRKDREDAYERYQLAQAEKRRQRRNKRNKNCNVESAGRGNLDEDAENSNIKNIFLKNASIKEALKCHTNEDVLPENDLAKDISKYKDENHTNEDASLENDPAKDLTKNKDAISKELLINNIPASKILKKKVKKKRKNVNDTKSTNINYNTLKSRLRRARLTQEQKAIIREKDKIRKRQARLEKKIPKIGDMTKKEKKNQRKIWRDTKRAYRKRKQSLMNVINATPPTSDIDDYEELDNSGMPEKQDIPVEDVIPVKNCDRYEKTHVLRNPSACENNKKVPDNASISTPSTSTNNVCLSSTNFDVTPKLLAAKKRRRKKMREIYKKMERMQQELEINKKQIEKLKRDKTKYKKRLERFKKASQPNSCLLKAEVVSGNSNFEKNILKENDNNGNCTIEDTSVNNLSPNTQVTKLLKERVVPPDIKKELLFGVALKEQIKSNIKEVDSSSNQKLKHVARSIISGGLLTKYKLHTKIKDILPYRENKTLSQINKRKYERKRRYNPTKENAKIKIRAFFENDRISRMCPGKANFITRKKIKKQKRILLYSLNSCFANFRLQNPNIHISFTTFYRNKPFWVVQPTTKDRETCACVKHENFKYIVGKMFNEKMITHQNVEKVVKNDFHVTLSEESKSDTLKLCQWKTQTEERKIRTKTKLVRITSKVSTEMTKLQLLELLQRELPIFKIHLDTMHHQMEFMDHIKKNLLSSEIAIQIDFSENYAAKLCTEIQSMHFGANKKQISIHTGVAYIGNGVDSQPTTISFATLSDNLDHHAYAIWAHMKPILTLLSEKVDSQNILKVFMFSDGPSSQYRNKYNIHLATKYLQCFFPHSGVSWNYSASGHGKGPMDGIGGTVKRLADNAVLRGGDITSAKDLIGLIKPHLQKTYLFEIDPNDIVTEKEKLNLNIPNIKKITKAHQITWSSLQTDSEIYLRLLSCDKCPLNVQCSHFSIDQQPTRLKDNSVSESMPQQMAMASQIEKVVPAVGTWIAVVYEEYWYPGVIVKVKNDQLTTKFLERKGKSYRWPLREDIQEICFKDILYILTSEPKSVSKSRQSLFLIPEEDIINDILKSLK